MLDRKPHKQSFVHGQLPAIGDFHLAVRAACPAGPRHDVRAPIELALLVTLLQKVPDRFVVLGRKSEVAAAPFRTSQPRDDLVCRTADDFVAGGGEFDRSLSSPTGAGHLAQLVGIVPVHPVTQSNRLFGLPGGVAEDAVLACIRKPIEPQSFHFLFRWSVRVLFRPRFRPTDPGNRIRFEIVARDRTSRENAEMHLCRFAPRHDAPPSDCWP